MKSNYKPIGNYIQKVENRNRDLNVTRLLGLSMTKEFRETTSNVVGTDMSVYKVMSKYQFACDFMSPIRVNKLPVVLKLDDEPNLVSPAYPVFEIIDRTKLDPEYLMMWFRRPEFDRYVTFKCDAAIRGGYEWNELCETLIPIPSITKQKEIVKEYNVIQNRIALNQQLIQKLEETAQAIYTQWFVDFEFPDENGKPYKSNGGEMVFSRELEREIPLDWKAGTLEDLYEFQYGKGNVNPDNGGKYPIYGSNGVIGGFNEFNSENNPIIGHIGTAGSLVFAFNKHFVTYNGIICNILNENIRYFGFITLLSKNLKEQVRGSTQPFLSYDILYEIQTLIPNLIEAIQFDNIAKKILMQINLFAKENKKLIEFSDLLLYKLATIEN